MSLDEVAAGAWAGLVGTVLGYPLDVVKSRMQTGKTGVVSASDAPAKANFGAPRAPVLVHLVRAADAPRGVFAASPRAPRTHARRPPPPTVSDTTHLLTPRR